MDDPAFPDSHYTTATTTTTTTTVQSPPLALDRAYLTSVPGILRIIEIIVNLIYWILLAACGYYIGFPLSVSISSWVLTIFFFVLFLLQLDKRVTVVNWIVTELLHDLVWTIFHFIAACIVASRAANFYYNHGCISFSAVLGFALMILYGLSTFCNLRIFQAGGGLSRLTGGSGGAGRTATSTTITTTEYNSEKQDDMPPPYTNP